MELRRQKPSDSPQGESIELVRENLFQLQGQEKEMRLRWDILQAFLEKQSGRLRRSVKICDLLVDAQVYFGDRLPDLTRLHEAARQELEAGQDDIMARLGEKSDEERDLRSSIEEIQMRVLATRERLEELIRCARQFVTVTKIPYPDPDMVQLRLVKFPARLNLRNAIEVCRQAGAILWDLASPGHTTLLNDVHRRIPTFISEEVVVPCENNAVGMIINRGLISYRAVHEGETTERRLLLLRFV